MIRLILVLTMYLLSLIGFSQTKAQSFKITATVVYAASDKGKVYFALYSSKANFLSRKPMATAIGNIKNGHSKIEFTKVKPGTYAIICYHDANDNGKMDFQDNGIPLEDYGMTNNVMNFGPPLFEDGKFEVIDSDLKFIIKF